MPTYYLETSALIKRYKSEPGSEVVRELFTGARSGETFVTSHFTVLEVSTVAARMLKGREIRRRQYERLIASLLRDLRDYQVRVLAVDDTLVDDALALLPGYAMRAPDALHFATALTYQRRAAVSDLYVVSGDKDIADTARAYSLGLIDPEAPEAVGHLRGLR